MVPETRSWPTVLIAGGAGYIGRHTAKVLSDAIQFLDGLVDAGVRRVVFPSVALSMVSRTPCYFNAARADPGGELGEHHDPETHLIPLAIHAAIGRKPLRVFGTDYPTLDGTAIRDYIHVTDLAAAHLRAMRYLMEDGEPVTLNLGSGTGHSVREVIQAVEAQGGVPVPVEYGPRREGDAPALVADSTRPRDVLGWRP